MRIIHLILFNVLFILGLSAQLPELTFTPHWLPQAQFAGYYVALEKGFYQNEGINVSIEHPSASVMATEQLFNGKSDLISLFLTTALSKKGNGANLVNIAQLSQNSALLFVTKKENGLNSLNDLDGKRIGIWESGFDEVPRDLMKSQNCSITWVPILSSINMFIVGGVDAMTVMWYNEYDQIINAGINPDELTRFFMSDYGYNIPEDGVYCLESTLAERKDDLYKFVKASLKGWEYAQTHKEETLEIVLDVMKKEHIATNLAHQKWMLDRVLELIDPGKKKIKKGELSISDYEKTQQILLKGNYLTEEVPFKEFYKPVMGNR